MAHSNLDFAPPIAKTIGCFVAILALPLSIVPVLLGHPAFPPHVYYVCAFVTVAGLACLLGRPLLIQTVCRGIADIVAAWTNRRNNKS